MKTFNLAPRKCGKQEIAVQNSLSLKYFPKCSKIWNHLNERVALKLIIIIIKTLFNEGSTK